MTEAEDYYKDYVAAVSGAVPVNNWDNQMYAASLLLWQLTGNNTYENDIEVTHLLSYWSTTQILKSVVDALHSDLCLAAEQ